MMKRVARLTLVALGPYLQAAGAAESSHGASGQAVFEHYKAGAFLRQGFC